jgi:hypothetical protein
LGAKIFSPVRKNIFLAQKHRTPIPEHSREVAGPGG